MASKRKNKKDKDLVTIHAKWDMFLSLMPYLIILFFVIVIRTYIATPINVNGTSMNPNLDNGDIMLLYKLSKHTRGIKRFDIVVVKTESNNLIKRVIGLPGDRVRYEVKEENNGKKIATLYINDKKVKENFLTEKYKVATCESEWTVCTSEVKVPEGEYFVMGDNRGNSSDSRYIGTIPFEDILGITNIVLFPFNHIGKVK